MSCCHVLDDDPTLEHARWFPECEYLLKWKGQEYITMVQTQLTAQVGRLGCDLEGIGGGFLAPM